LTINGAPSTDQQGQTMPLPIRSFPPGGAGGTNPAPSLPQNPAPSQPAPAPPAEPQNTQSQNLPADLLARIQAGGENIIGSLRDPLTGGTWYLGSKGGIFAVGGARFLGSARQYGFDNPAIRSAVNITPLGTGYRVTSSRGETYDFAQ
jgi:hypothetical protein